MLVVNRLFAIGMLVVWFLFDIVWTAVAYTCALYRVGSRTLAPVLVPAVDSSALDVDNI